VIPTFYKSPSLAKVVIAFKSKATRGRIRGQILGFAVLWARLSPVKSGICEVLANAGAKLAECCNDKYLAP